MQQLFTLWEIAIFYKRTKKHIIINKPTSMQTQQQATTSTTAFSSALKSADANMGIMLAINKTTE